MSNADSDLKRIKDTVESMLQDLDGGNAILFQSKIPRITTEATSSASVSEKSWVNIMEDMKADCPINISISQKQENKETANKEKCQRIEEIEEIEEGKTDDNVISTSSMNNQTGNDDHPLPETRVDNVISPTNQSILLEEVLPSIEMNYGMGNQNQNQNSNDNKDIPTTSAIQLHTNEQTFLCMKVNEENIFPEENSDKKEGRKTEEQQYLQPNPPSPQTGLKRILDELDHAILESSHVSTSSSEQQNQSLSPSHDPRPVSTTHLLPKPAFAELPITHLVFTYIANHGCAVGLFSHQYIYIFQK